MENKKRLEISYVIEMVKRETVIAKGINNTRDNVNLPIDLVLVLIEQAERVQELENTLRIWMDRSDYLSGEYLEFKDKNKYYRGILGFYADKENYKEFNDIMRTRKVTMILEDSGIKARQALEGDTQRHALSAKTSQYVPIVSIFAKIATRNTLII